MNTKWAMGKNPSMAFCVIAILRFLLNETRPKLTNFRGEITKGSTFESDLFQDMKQYFSSPYPL